MNNNKNAVNPLITTTLCVLFAILFGIWTQPHTLFIRYVCMYGGAGLGLYVLWRNKSVLVGSKALPIYLILALVGWITFHLFFIGVNWDAQYMEYIKVWKRIIICIPFAAGLGIAVAKNFDSSAQSKRDWQIIYFGLLLPSLIYFIKYAVTFFSIKYGIEISPFFLLDNNHLGSVWGISRAAYVFFCIPVFAVALAEITYGLKDGNLGFKKSIIYLSTLPLPLAIFYIENDRTGTLMALLLVLVASLIFIFSRMKKITAKEAVTFVVVLTMLATFIVVNIHRNEYWANLIADGKVAIQVDKYDNWKYNRIKMVGYPVNEYGVEPSGSNYERISWAIVGARMVPEHPLGYGLMTLSFKYLGLQKWPDVETSLSHSAWLDFTLGYGLPGLFLFFGSSFLAWRNGRELPLPWKSMARWVLGILMVMFVIKELSMEIFVNAYIFLIVFIAALSLGYKKKIN